MQTCVIQCRPACLAGRPAPARTRAARRAGVPPTVPRSSVMKGDAVDLSGEWEAVDSLGSQDDVLAWHNHQHETKNVRLHDVMQTDLLLTSPEASLEEVKALLDGPPFITGLPVVDADKKLVGVISGKDLSKGGSCVNDVMSTNPISLKASGTVLDAATLMIEHKFHRVPVVDEAGTCVGIVTRTDIFWALTQSDQEGDTSVTQHGLDA